MVLYVKGSNIKQRATVTTNTSSSNINKQITSNKIPKPIVAADWKVSQIGSGDPNLRANQIIKPETKDNNLLFLQKAYGATEVPATFLPNDPNRIQKYEEGLKNRESLVFGSAPASTSGLDNINSGQYYAGQTGQDPIIQEASVPASQSYEEEVAPKETQTAYNDWYNNHAGKMNFNQYKQKFGITSGSQQVALNFSVGTNFGSAGAETVIPDEYNSNTDQQVSSATEDYFDMIAKIPNDYTLEKTGTNAPGFIDKKTTFFGTAEGKIVPVESKVKKVLHDSNIDPQHLVNTWALGQSSSSNLPAAMKYGGLQNYTTDAQGVFIDPLTGEPRGASWNPITGKYNEPTGTKVKTYGVGSEGESGQIAAEYYHGYSSNQNKIGGEGVFAAGTDMWITGQEPTGGDRFGNKTIAELRASQNAGNKYNNIVSQWQSQHLRNANKKNPEKQIKAITNFVDKKIAQIEGWNIGQREKEYYIKDLESRRDNLMTIVGPDPLSGIRVGQDKWLGDYSDGGKYLLSRGAVGSKPNKVLTWKDLQNSGY
jgi:hypothetical protein